MLSHSGLLAGSHLVTRFPTDGGGEGNSEKVIRDIRLIVKGRRLVQRAWARRNSLVSAPVIMV